MVERFAKQWPEWQEKQNASFPVGRIGRPSELASLIGFLFSAQCPMMTGTVHSSKERRRPLLLRPFWTVT